MSCSVPHKTVFVKIWGGGGGRRRLLECDPRVGPVCGFVQAGQIHHVQQFGRWGGGEGGYKIK